MLLYLAICILICANYKHPACIPFTCNWYKEQSILCGRVIIPQQIRQKQRLYPTDCFLISIEAFLYLLIWLFQLATTVGKRSHYLKHLLTTCLCQFNVLPWQCKRVTQHSAPVVCNYGDPAKWEHKIPDILKNARRKTAEVMIVRLICQRCEKSTMSF